MEIIIEEYADESEKCKCEKEDCDKCDPDWQPGIDTEEESDYDSDDSMDDVYSNCGLTRKEKKQLQDELDYLIETAEVCCPNCTEKAMESDPELPPDPVQK